MFANNHIPDATHATQSLPGKTTAMPFFQPKLTINAPGDQYEQEADAMAERVGQAPQGTGAVSAADAVGTVQRQVEDREEEPVQRKCSDCEKEEKERVQRQEKEPEEESVQRKCSDCEKKEKERVQRQEKEPEEEPVQRQPEKEEEKPPVQMMPLMRKSAGGGYTATPALSNRLSASKGGGSVLPAPTRAHMESAFGADFSRVRIHTDRDAAEMNAGISARAFTHGSDIYFNNGQYAPENGEGKRLLAHELTHVVQQGGSERKRNIRTTMRKQIIQRSVTDQYPIIRRNLRRSLFDWAIRANEANQVLDILIGLADQNLIDTHFQMVADGLWGKFEGNVPEESQPNLQQLNARIQRLMTIGRLTRSDQDLIREICLIFFPDNHPDCINDQVAVIALDMVYRASRCDVFMDIIPRPPARPSLLWLLRQAAAPFIREARRGGRHYRVCLNGISYHFRGQYDDARGISCHEVSTPRGARGVR